MASCARRVDLVQQVGEHLVDTEAIDFRTEEGLEEVIRGITDTVPGAKRLFA